MKNFGLLKTTVENALVKSYKRPEFKKTIKEFKEFVTNNKAVGKIYLNYGAILKTKNLSEDVAEQFISISIDDIKTTIKENKRQFEEFDSWVETLEPVENNEYEILDNLVFAESAEQFLRLVESKQKLQKLLTEKITDKNAITETIKIPLTDMFGIVANTFSSEYSNLSESQLFELKSLMKMSNEELYEGIERLKKEVTEKLDSVNIDDEETKMKILETKERVLNTQIDSLSYYKLKELSKGL